MGRIGERWLDDTNVKLVRGPIDIPSLAGSFGVCNYKLYEAYAPGRRFSQETPYLVVWLHGQTDMHVITTTDIAQMALKFNRRIVCFAPTNPGKCNGNEFFWAQQFNKEQNRNGLGFVYGSMNYEVLATFCNLIQQVVRECRAERTIMGGYSMGGFGAFQLAGYRPDIFDAIFSIAGHGVGTLLRPSEGFNCPQPDGQIKFANFLDTHCPNLAKIPVTIAIHSESDTLSSYHDMEVIIERIVKSGGSAALVTVPEELANSDSSGKKSKMSHGYFKFALHKETSEAALYGPIKTALWSDSCVYRKDIAAMEADMAAINAAAQARAAEEARAVAEMEREKAEAEQKIRDEEKKKEDEEKARRLKLLNNYLGVGDGDQNQNVVALELDGSEKKRDLSPDSSEDSSDERKKAKKQKKAEKKEKEKQKADRLAEIKRKRIQERRAGRSGDATGSKPVAVDIESSAPVAKAAPMSDEEKRQQMRERRKKFLEQKA